MASFKLKLFSKEWVINLKPFFHEQPYMAAKPPSGLENTSNLQLVCSCTTTGYSDIADFYQHLTEYHLNEPYKKETNDRKD